MLWALLGKFSENSCQRNNNNLGTRRDQRKTTVLPESTLNFAYIHIKNSFLKNFNFLLKSDGIVPPQKKAKEVVVRERSAKRLLLKISIKLTEKHHRGRTFL